MITAAYFCFFAGRFHSRRIWEWIMEDWGIYDIRLAWLDTPNEAGPCLPEDVVDMSMRLVDINEQMHPVTTLKGRAQNGEIYDISGTTVARLNK